MHRDLQYLLRLWDALCRKLDGARPPKLVYQESDLIIRCMRDLFTSDTDEIIIDNEAVCMQVREFLSIIAPSYQDRVKLYQGKAPIFTKFRVEQAVNEVYSRRVALPHGGSIVIDQTEALVAIDVNSGKYTEETDAEITAYRTNMEAAPEIARQLRLRDLGGLIVIDFIDMKHEKHRRDVEKALHEAMRRDRARRKMLRISQFGLVQMTRQRMRPSVARAVFARCPTCDGSGQVRTLESITLDIMRQIPLAIPTRGVEYVDCWLHPDVALHLLNNKRPELTRLEQTWDTKIRVKADNNLKLQDFRIQPVKGGKPAAAE